MKYIYLIALLILASCKNGEKVKATNEINLDRVSFTKEQLANTKIKIGTADQRNMVNKIQINGVIDVPPQNMVSIGSHLGGYLKSSKLLPGMHINKGDVLAILEDQQYIELQKDYLTTQIKVNILSAEYERQKTLNASKASSDKLYQQAKGEFQMQRILLQSLSEKLELIGINPEEVNEHNISKTIALRSPINGYVSKVNVNLGKYINPSEILFELVNPSDIHLNLKVYEKDIAKLRIGQKLICYNNSNPEKKYDCEIILISQNVNESNQIEVHCHFEKYSKELIPGMYMIGEINTENKMTTTVPESAVVSFEGKNYVFKAIDNNQFEWCEVQIGGTNNGNIEVIPIEKIDLTQTKIAVQDAYAILMKLKNTEE